MAQMVKNLPAMQETWVHSLGWKDPLEEGITTHSSILAWRVPVEPGRLQSMGLQRVGHNWVTNRACIITGVKLYLIVVLICISLIISNDEFLFISLLAIYMSSLEKCLSIPFWLGCLVFLILNCRSCLYIFDIKPLLFPSFANIFSQFIVFVCFVFFVISFAL